MDGRRRVMLMAGAIALVAAGAVLSHRIEPGVSVERVTIAGDVPALRFVPEGPGPHPVALLAHGITASKETLFRFGEGLASAGFTCVAMDFPGHGQSKRPFGSAAIREAIPRVASETGPVDVFLGHSMGAYVGTANLDAPNFQPRLFIAVGAVPDAKPQGPDLLILCGRFEEAVPNLAGRMSRLPASPGTRLIVSPWSDHALEPYDPVLIRAAVEAACAQAGKPVPRAPTRWILRLAGLAIAMLGAFALSVVLPALPSRAAWARGPAITAIHLVTIMLTATPWVGVAPVAKRLPMQLAAMLLAGLALHLAGKLKLPRWSYSAALALLAVVLVLIGAPFPALFAMLTALVLGAGALLGAIAARGGSRRDGDLAMAILLGYAFGQWFPLVY